MDQGASKNKYYTFMVVPHEGEGKPLSFRVSSKAIRVALLFVVLCAVAFTGSLFYSTILSKRLINYDFIVNRDAESNKKLEDILTKKDTIKNELQSVLDQNNELRKTLGLKVNKTKIEFDNKRGKKQKKQSNNFLIQSKDITNMLVLSYKEAEGTKISVSQIKDKFRDIQKKLASTPSSWPLRGSITSSYGYRVSPWRGMHTGIDIKASFGAAVHATAPGVVCFSGWRQGYGKAVEVDHGNGFKSLYGHNSALLVTVGERIKRGQTISYVGMTGYTTGPHLHYEVRKYDNPINPVAFLDFNIRTAAKYF